MDYAPVFCKKWVIPLRQLSSGHRGHKTYQSPPGPGRQGTRNTDKFKLQSLSVESSLSLLFSTNTLIRIKWKTLFESFREFEASTFPIISAISLSAACPAGRLRVTPIYFLLDVLFIILWRPLGATLCVSQPRLVVTLGTISVETFCQNNDNNSPCTNSESQQKH